MDFYIQMGHGMQSMSKELLALWGGGTVILSPRDIQVERLSKFSLEVAKLNGSVVFDPQLYFPEKEHRKLIQYDYWKTSVDEDVLRGRCEETIEKLALMNEGINAEAFILPSASARKITTGWNEAQLRIIECGYRHSPETRIWQTVTLSPDVIADEEQVETIVHYAEGWSVDGVYLVFERPDDAYLVDRPEWMANLLSLVAGIGRQDKKTIVGYASQQLLCLALAGCDAIASGNFLNVRKFHPARFENNDDSSPSRRATWYYSPQAFSEYKVTFLDIADRLALLSTMKPPASMINQFSDMLFAGVKPSSTSYSEFHSHRHYLHCLRQQSLEATRATYEDTRDGYFSALDTASILLDALRKKGIRGQDRDFGDIVDVNRAALAAFNDEWGSALSHSWKSSFVK